MQVNDQQNKVTRPKHDLLSHSSFKLDPERLNSSQGSISWLHASNQEEWGDISLDSMIHTTNKCCIKKAKIWAAVAEDEGNSYSSSLDKMLNDSGIEDSINNLFLSLSQRSLLVDICNNKNNYSTASLSTADVPKDITESQDEAAVEAKDKRKAHETSILGRNPSGLH